MNSRDNPILAKDYSFVGLPRKYNYTHTPDIAFDLFPHLLTGAEIKVLDYIFRRSSLEDEDVSLNQMHKGLITRKGERLDFGCGVKSKKTITTALSKLAKLKLIEVLRRTGHDGRHLANIYRLKYSAEGLEEPSVLQNYIEKNLKPSAENFSFDGVLLPTFTPIPDVVYDVFPHVLSHRAYLIVRYVCRHTFGWKKKTDNISLHQMMHGVVKKDGTRIDYGCGIKKKASIVAGVKEAESQGILVVRRNKNSRGGNATTTLGLKFKENTHTSTPSVKREPPSVKREPPYDKKGTTPSVKREPPYGKKGTHKTTEEQNTAKQNTEEQQHSANGTHSKNSVGHSVVVLLQEQGFSELVAKELGKGRAAEYIKQKIEYLKFEQSRPNSIIKNPLAWLRTAIEKDYGEPGGFKTESERLKQAENERKEQERVQRALTLSEQAEAESERLQQERKEQLISTYQTQYQTADTDLRIWKELSQAFSQHPNYKYLAPMMHGLKFDQAAKKATIGVHHRFHLKDLEHPKTHAGLMREISFVMNVELESLVFVLFENGENSIKNPS